MSTASTHSSHVAHHFKTAEQQFEAAKLGIWLFLCTEVLMFGGLFVGYIIFHGLYPETFAEGASFLNWKLGALNTVVLLLSSYTMAMGIHYAQTNKRDKSLQMLAITLICGFIFMAVKTIEYRAKFEHGFLPGHLFSPHEEGLDPKLAIYFGFYFCMTGLHGIHVLGGMGLIAWIMKRTARGDFSSEFYTPVEGVGLFWHLVDLIWIYLFPLLYLVG